MHSDQTVSLRPGGGKGRLFGVHISSSTTTIVSSSIAGNSFNDPLFPPCLNHDGMGMDSRAQNLPSERLKYSREELYKYKEVIRDIPQDIKDAITEIEDELSVAEEPEWARPATNAQTLPSATRYTELDNRDWKSRAPLPSLVPEEKGKEQQQKESGKRSDSDWRDREQERDVPTLQTSHQQEPQYSYRQQESQYPKQQESAASGGPASAIIRAANPWTARREVVSEKEKVLRNVKGILNKLTPEKFELLLDQLLNAGIDSAEILKGVISLVFEKAVLEPTFCPMYAKLCVHLSKALPEFPSDEGDGKPVTFRRILLNSCQEDFEGADNMRAEIRQLTKPEQELEYFEKGKLLKLRTLGNIRLIGELFKQKMIPEKIVHYCIQMLLGSDLKTSPAEENLEALCQLLATVGKQLDQSAKSTKVTDSYFSQLKDFSTNSCLPPRIRFMIQNIIDMRGNEWVPRREEVKAKTINEIHAEAEHTLGLLRPGITGLRNGRGAPGVMGMPGVGNNFPLSRPGSMMPRMPGLLPGGGKMPGAAPLVPNFIPVVDSEGWETISVNRKNKIPREGSIPPPNAMPGRPLGMPDPGPRPNSASSKLLPKGSGGSFLGRPSALLGDSAVRAVATLIPRQNVGVLEPLNQGPGIAPKLSQKERITGPPLKQTAPVASLSPAALQMKSESMLKEYLSVADLNEAALCVEELQSREFYPQLVQLAVSMFVESQDRERALIRKLLEYLYSKKVFSEKDVRTGIMLVAEQLEDLALDIPMAPKHLGDLVGAISLSDVVDLGLLVDILQKTEDLVLKKVVYDAALRAIKSGPNAERALSQQSELQECERLVEMAAR